MIVIHTLADHIAHDHEIWASCPHCDHGHQIDLGAIIKGFEGAGDMTPNELRARLRCGKCHKRGGMQLTVSAAVTKDMRPHG